MICRFRYFFVHTLGSVVHVAFFVYQDSTYSIGGKLHILVYIFYILPKMLINFSTKIRISFNKNWKMIMFNLIPKYFYEIFSNSVTTAFWFHSKHQGFDMWLISNSWLLSLRTNDRVNFHPILKTAEINPTWSKRYNKI